MTKRRTVTVPRNAQTVLVIRELMSQATAYLANGQLDAQARGVADEAVARATAAAILRLSAANELLREVELI